MVVGVVQQDRSQERDSRNREELAVAVLQPPRLHHRRIVHAAQQFPRLFKARVKRRNQLGCARRIRVDELRRLGLRLGRDAGDASGHLRNVQRELAKRPGARMRPPAEVLISDEPQYSARRPRFLLELLQHHVDESRPRFRCRLHGHFPSTCFLTRSKIFAQPCPRPSR
jgi:hypothetical protein